MSSFFWDKIGLEVMFDHHVVKEQAHLDKKNSDFT